MAENKKGKTVHSGGRPPKNGATTRNGQPVKAKKRKNKVVLFIVEIIVLLILLGVFWVISQGNKIDYVELKEEDIVINKDENNDALDYSKPTDEAKKGYRNIALFGVDSREKELKEKTRTDTIMIVSINMDTGEARLVSLYRDTYLNLGTDTYNKCNLAYFYGGAKQAVNMLNTNFDLDIKDYVTVGFDAVVDLIDAIGGVEIDVKEEEIIHLNNFQICYTGRQDGTLNAAGEPNYVADEGKDYTAVKQPGLQNLNGVQALGYMRIRYVGNDYGRTERQRTVVSKVAKKAITLNPAQISKITNAVFPKITTSFSIDEILELATGAAKYSMGEHSGFPFQNEFSNINRFGSKGSCIIPNTLEDNVVLLHKFFFNEENYTVSETAKKYSDKIKEDSAPYLK